MKLVILTLCTFLTCSFVNGLRQLSIDQIATEMTKDDVDEYLQTILATPEAYPYFSRLMSKTDLGLVDQLADSCMDWDEDVLDSVIGFVNSYPQYRKYWLSPTCISMLPAELVVRLLNEEEQDGEVGITFSSLPWRVKTAEERDRWIAAMSYINDVDHDGDYRLGYMNEMLIDWNLIFATSHRPTLHSLPIHRIVRLPQLKEMMERLGGSTSEDYLLSYLSHQAALVRNFDNVQGIIYTLLCWYDSLLEGNKDTLYSRFRHALMATKSYLGGGWGNQLNEDLIDLIDFILVALLTSDGVVPQTIPTVLMERLLQPTASMETLQLSYYLARRLSDRNALIHVIVPRLRIFLGQPLHDRFEKLILIESIVQSRNGVALCQAIFHDTQYAILMNSRVTRYLDERVFGCLTPEQRIQYFRQWQRLPLPNHLFSLLLRESSATPKPVSSAVALGLLIQHYQSLPAILPHRGKTIPQLVKWFWSRYFKLTHILTIVFEEHEDPEDEESKVTKYLEIDNDQVIRPIEVILLRQAIIAITLLRLHSNVMVVQLRRSFVKSILFCKQDSEDLVIATLRRSNPLKRALSIAYNILPSPNKDVTM